MVWDFSWIMWSVLVSPKVNHIGFGAHGHVQKSQNHRNEGFERSHITKSKQYKSKMDQNNKTQLLSISFPSVYHNSDPQIATHVKNVRVSGFFRISIGIYLKRLVLYEKSWAD